MIKDRILDYEINQLPSSNKPMNLFFLFMLLIGSGGLFGAITNLINGKVSKEYFRRIMGWDFEGIWKAAILQGIFEGLIYGLIFSFIFTIGFGIITSRKANWQYVKKQLKKILIIVFACWIIGGIVAIILAFVVPESYDKLLYAVPKETSLRIGYAWVGGSIWGGIIGGLVSIIIGLIYTYKEWKIN